MFNYSYQNVTGQNGAQIDYSPHHKVNLVLNTDERRRVMGYLAAHFVGESQQASAAIHSYTTLDAKIGYRVNGAENPWTISLAATNLLDDRHSEYVDTVNVLSSAKYAEAQRRTLWLRVDGKF
ncbi:MAG: TonB-dependent receptor [Capsulimonas sp.]|uniref:TonB-dependent receptor domain-containing protein n=1 Tax=Capsulimonas sp. TaxID=2494211 RepID=UPI00326354E9